MKWRLLGWGGQGDICVISQQTYGAGASTMARLDVQFVRSATIPDDRERRTVSQVRIPVETSFRSLVRFGSFRPVGLCRRFHYVLLEIPRLLEKILADGVHHRQGPPSEQRDRQPPLADAPAAPSQEAPIGHRIHPQVRRNHEGQDPDGFMHHSTPHSTWLDHHSCLGRRSMPWSLNLT